MTTVRERGLHLLRQHFQDLGWRVRESKRGRLTVLVVDLGELKRLVRWPTKSSGTWQTSIAHEPFAGNDNPDRFWAFVAPSAAPEIHVVPEHAARTAILQGRSDYLAQHNGQQARNDKSTHFAMNPHVVEQLVLDYPTSWR